MVTCPTVVSSQVTMTTTTLSQFLLLPLIRELIGWLQYWEAVVLINPSILVQIFTCTMQGIVDNNSGTNQTELPVAFQIRTRYHCRDGSELHMIVGLGMNVSVNLVISNAWMR